MIAAVRFLVLANLQKIISCKKIKMANKKTKGGCLRFGNEATNNMTDCNDVISKTKRSLQNSKIQKVRWKVDRGKLIVGKILEI